MFCFRMFIVKWYHKDGGAKHKQQITVRWFQGFLSEEKSNGAETFGAGLLLWILSNHHVKKIHEGTGLGDFKKC